MTVFTATLGGTVSNPVRWMAPELLDPEAFGLKESRRTTASDIYAFACVGLEVGNGPSIKWTITTDV